MDAPAVKTITKINRWLPYLAVFQADVRQTLTSWVYRTWVFVSLIAALGYLLYRFGVYHEAKIVQPASLMISDLLRWTVIGSVTLIILLTAGAISSERGTLADSVLSRGISRHQYFLGKWHARLVTVLGTFLVMGGLALIGSVFLLHEDLELTGSLLALAAVAALLAAVVTCGVTVSAVSPSTVVAIAVLWLSLYGVGFTLSLLPAPFPSPERLLGYLPHVLRGQYDPNVMARLIGGALGISLLVAVLGLVCFARRDV